MPVLISFLLYIFIYIRKSKEKRNATPEREAPEQLGGLPPKLSDFGKHAETLGKTRVFAAWHENSYPRFDDV